METLKKLCELTGLILAELKISTIFLKDPTFEGFFHVFMCKTSEKLEFTSNCRVKRQGTHEKVNYIRARICS